MAVTRGDRLPGGRRPDQDYDPPGPLVAPGGRAGIFRGRLVVIGGGGPPGSGLFVYSPSPGAGNLIASIAAAAGTDPYGNTVKKGIADYTPSPGLLIAILDQASLFLTSQKAATTISGAAAVQLADAVTGSGQPNIGMFSPTTSALGQSQVVAWAESQDATKQAFVELLGPQTLVHVSGVPAPATATLLEIQGTEALKNSAAPAAVVGYAEPFAIGGNLAFVNGLTGDGATYDTGRRTIYSTGQTVNSATFANINGVGAIPLGIGTYHIKGVIVGTTNVAGGVAQIRFLAGGGLVAAGFSAWIEEHVITAGGGAVTWGNGNDINLSPAVFSSSTLGAANRRYEIDITCPVTTAGTLAPQVAVTIAADTWTVTADSYFEIFPVN